MVVKLLIEQFILEKEIKPSNVNELLDFASLCYLNNTYTIAEYRMLFRELMLRGATKPEYYIDEEACELII